MARHIKDAESEELIKQTAKRLFFEEGRFSATTQEIADEAGVNRTLINYYFRSRDNLIDIVFKDAIKKEEELREEILSFDLPFKEKMEKYLDEHVKRNREFPYLESYIVSRLNDGGFYEHEEDWLRFMERFHADYKEEVEKGGVIDIELNQFLINVAALTTFPMAARPLLQSVLRIDDKEYNRLMEERKEVIMKILFKE